MHWQTLSTLSSNRWYHVAATWQNVNSDVTDAKIYIDGVEQAAEIDDNRGVYDSTFLPGYTTLPLFIGRDEFPSGHFKGLVDEVDIYDRVLSAAEVQSMFFAGSAGKCKKVGIATQPLLQVKLGDFFVHRRLNPLQARRPFLGLLSTELSPLA